MMTFRRTILALALAAATLVGAACGGGDDDDGDATSTSTRSAATSSARTPSGSATTAGSEDTPVAGETAQPGATTAPAPDGGAADPPPPAPGGGRTFTAAEAAGFIDAVLLKPGDLSGQWSVMSDTTTDNAAAAAADPESAASNERCGRLLGRTATNSPADLVERYISGETVSFFSQVTLYATQEGAADCAAEAAVRLSEPGALARAFGGIFINPDAVEVTPVQYPQLADGSFATTLRGQINAQGTIVDLTILIVAFREDNATAVVGSAAASAPAVDELTPLVNLVHSRLQQQLG
jgi:hypothetical protein